MASGTQCFHKDLTFQFSGKFVVAPGRMEDLTFQFNGKFGRITFYL